jgi:hypothetical protein
MASLGGTGESVAVVVGAGELGNATATLPAGARFTVVAVDHTPTALDELPGGIAFLVVTAPRRSAVRSCPPVAPGLAASHPATPRCV